MSQRLAKRKEKQAGGDEQGRKGKKEAMDDDIVVLKSQQAIESNSEVELAEPGAHPMPTTLHNFKVHVPPTMIDELPASLDLARPVWLDGPLNSHPPTPAFLSTPATSTWTAPAEWCVPGDRKEKDEVGIQRLDIRESGRRAWR
jgi:hypothetical protein